MLSTIFPEHSTYPIQYKMCIDNSYREQYQNMYELRMVQRTILGHQVDYLRSGMLCIYCIKIK